MTPTEILTNARNMIAHPSRWTQHEIARNSASEAVPAIAQDATCWCALGAVHRSLFDARQVMGSPSEVAFIFLARAANIEADDDTGGSTPAFNDSHTHAEVLAMFDRAIELASQAPSAPGDRLTGAE